MITTYKVKFTVEVPTKGCDGVLLECSALLPFLPVAGMQIVAIAGDDYRKIEEVYWSDKDGFEAFLEFAEFAKPKVLKKLGWTEVK